MNTSKAGLTFDKSPPAKTARRIDILIPTYNRSRDLSRNIELLNKLIKRECPDWSFQILVSNNASEDDTATVLEHWKDESEVELCCFHQPSNLGGEGNVVFLLARATAERVMIIGDDDYLPEGYLSEVCSILAESPRTEAIVPGIASLYPDGRVANERNEQFSRRRYKAGKSAVLAISYLGHQISGIVFRREGMLDAYLRDESLRNIYPTVFFLGYSAERGEVCYLPSKKVLVSQGNKKYWSYDASGLLSEMFLNYRILYPRAPWTRLLMCLNLIYLQPSRLGTYPLSVLRGTIHLMFAAKVDPLVRIVLPPVSLALYLLRVLRFLLRRLRLLR